jgi:hypothetical protein
MTSGTGPDTTATEFHERPRARPPSQSHWRDLKALPAIARFLWRSSRGYRLRPWASPYLRWRIETYWGWHADQIGALRFWKFTWRHRRELWRFLLWAGAMASQQDHRLHS